MCVDLVKIYQEFKKCDKEDSFGKQHQINNWRTVRTLASRKRASEENLLKVPFLKWMFEDNFLYSTSCKVEHNIG